ncbi:MAG: DUF2924 domain-containing protein [Bryobacterales bacterium]|nr:DUF2924 domain-containing protein [Bryobacterales bacterium]
MDVAALRTRHLEFFGKKTSCAHRKFLFRKLAWRLQAQTEGGLPESAVELARSIAPGHAAQESRADEREPRWTTHRRPPSSRRTMPALRCRAGLSPSSTGATGVEGSQRLRCLSIVHQVDAFRLQ